MIVDIFLFPLFCLLLVWLGRGTIRVGIFFGGSDPSLVQYRYSLLLLAGLFTIGAFALVANFFVGLNHTFISMFYFLMILVGGVKRKIESGVRLRLAVASFAIIFLIAPLAAFVSPGYDGGLYHLPHQLWLRENTIVIGLANFHGRFGFSSFQEYILAPLWIEGSLKLPSYVVPAFVASLLLYLLEATQSKQPRLLLAAVGIALSLLSYDEYIVWSYTYTDLSAGILLVLSVLSGYTLLNKDNWKAQEVFEFLFFSLFAFIIKVSNLLVVVWVLYVFVYGIRTAQMKRSIFKSVLLYGGAILILWTIRGFLNSGCFLYPVSATCTFVPWSAFDNAVNDSAWITAWARHPRSGLYSLYDSSWFSNWWYPRYLTFLNAKFLSVLLVLIITLLLLWALFERYQRMKPIHFAPLLFVFCLLVFWFINAPDPRFAIGPLMLLDPVLGVAASLSFSLRTVSRQISLGAAFIVIILAVKFGLPLAVAGYAKPFDLKEVPYAKKIVRDSRFGVRPGGGDDRCWGTLLCAPYDRPKPQTIYDFTVFYPPANVDE